MDVSEWSQIHRHIFQLEQEGLVTRTFRRLDPERQQAILTAILDEAVSKGPTALNIKEVAARAGVSVGSLYTYFGNREGLLAFTVELCIRFISDTFASFRPFLAAQPLREGLNMYLAGGVAWGQTQAGLMQFFAAAAYQGDEELGARFVRPIAAVLRDIVGDMLAQAHARGEVRPDVDLEATTRVIHALTIGIGDSQLLPYLNHYFQVHDANAPIERTTEAALDLILQGIGA